MKKILFIMGIGDWGLGIGDWDIIDEKKQNLKK